jgi:transcriptional regulator with XRE-family HTH domain
MPDNDLSRKDVADRLRLAREQAGLSQGQVAEHLGVHRPAISEIEAGRRKVSAEELARLAALYDVSAAWLLEGPGDEGDAAVELAARELRKLKPEDLDSILRLLKSMRRAASGPSR